MVDFSDCLGMKFSCVPIMSMIHPYLFRPTTSHRYVLTMANTNYVGVIVDIFINNAICVAVSPAPMHVLSLDRHEDAGLGGGRDS